MARPLVGITTYVIPASFGTWEAESALVPADYVRAIERAGGRPLLVPPSTDGVEETLDALDGLVFSGGSDLDPALYGSERHPQTREVARGRDDAELALPPPLEGNAYESDAERFPGSLREAIEALEQGTMARAALGDEVVEHYLNYARIELQAFDAAVTDWERFRGFERL